MGYVVGAFIVIFLLGAGATFLRTGLIRHRQARTWPRAQGQVVGNDSQYPVSDGIDDIALSLPQVRFTTADGRTVLGSDDIGRNIPMRVGKEVELRYDPGDPRRIIVGNAGCAGVAHVAIGVLLIAIPLAAGAIYEWVPRH